ncbi:kin of IRRE-like protein 1 isoform X2 [Ylistrum balloti]|uniref:kin of IRRE-like protein 1 isoform X2 n=1 Tax=Ylistrum balloti TaxID=509963 RepID=UPI002905C28A|nr:kin of IRRE-like protein 1 isoform X2 [Ylistrum balloti]
MESYRSWQKMFVQSWLYLSVSLLIIARALGSQQFTAQPENTTTTQNSTVVLQCEVKNRQGTLQWTRNRLGLGTVRALPGFPRYSMVGGTNIIGGDRIEEYNLKIIDVQLEDDGEYRCQVTATEQTHGIITNKITLNVQLPPDPPQMGDTSTIAVIQGSPTNVSCQANNGKPGAEITWYQEGVRITHNVFSRTMTRTDKRADTLSVVTIVASKEDAGKKIECRANNPALRLPFKTHAILDVQYPPSLTMAHNISRPIREYDYVRFTCTGTANPYNIQWKWYHDGVVIDGSNQNYLDIPSIKRDYHQSRITCEGSNAVGSTRANEVLQVQYGPRFIGAPQHVAVDLGDPATLVCNAEGNPEPNILWTKQDYYNPVSTSPTFHIQEVEGRDLGTYICTATSMVAGFHEVSREILLLQKGPPKILSNKNQYAATGASARLECLVRSVPTPTKIKWERNNVEIDYANSGRYSELEEPLADGVKHMLQIMQVQESDFGQYNCSVENSRGSDLITITLLEKDILPLSYIIGGVVGGVALIFLIVIVFVIYHRYKASDSDSYAETDSNTEIKKREKTESPSDFTKSTLMDQWRQDLNFHCPTDYEDLYGQKATYNREQQLCMAPSIRTLPAQSANQNIYHVIPPYGQRSMTPCGLGHRSLASFGNGQRSVTPCGLGQRSMTPCEQKQRPMSPYEQGQRTLTSCGGRRTLPRRPLAASRDVLQCASSTLPHRPCWQHCAHSYVQEHKLNSSGYGTLTSDNYINAYDHHNGGPLFSDYVHRTDEALPAERFENGYNTYGTSSFRSASRTDFTNPDYTDPYSSRLPPADVNTAKLATTV